MSLGLHEGRQRRKKRARWIIAKWVIALSLIVAAGVVAYQTGSTLAERKVANLQKRIDELTMRLEEAQAENTDLQAKLILAQQRREEATQRYEKDVPTGRMADLLGRLRSKLDAGVDLERLEFLIAAADNPGSCDGKPITRRFLVQTPLAKGANDSVGFANGTVTLTAIGQSVTNEQGQVEAWFDPAQPITLKMARIGGETRNQTGILPLHASFVVDDSEHRFSLVTGKRGFVQVTGDRCDYP